MERSFFTITRSSSFSSFSSISDEKNLLPLSTHKKPNIQVRTLLGHCLYRRVILWVATILVVLCLGLSTTGVHLRHGRILDLVDFTQEDQRKNGSSIEDTNILTIVVSVDGQRGSEPSWLSFKQ